LLYAVPKEFLVLVPVGDPACSPCRRLVVEGEDGAMFILTIGLLLPVLWCALGHRQHMSGSVEWILVAQYYSFNGIANSQ
jgi:hypothetical protein